MAWKQGQQHHALMLLQEELKKKGFPSVDLENIQEYGKADPYVAKTLLKRANWMQITGNVQHDEIVVEYRKVIEIQPNEKGYFFLGRYFDSLFMLVKKNEGLEKAYTKRTRDTHSDNYFVQAVTNYGMSLQYSNNDQFIFQSLPRMLTLYFDFGAFCEEHQKNAVTFPLLFFK